MSAAITAAVITAGGAAYAANQANKAQDGLASNQRDPQSEIPLLAKLFPKLAMKSQMLDQQAAQAQLQTQQSFTKSLMNMYPQLAQAERQATTDQRRGDLADLRRFGTGIMQTLGRVNPGFASSLTALNNRVANAGQRTGLLGLLNTEAMNAGPSALRTGLEQQAAADLALGGALSAEESRIASQAARQGWADRGLMASNPALVDEALNRVQLSRARQNERRGFAAQVMQLANAENAQNRGFQLDTEGMNAQQLGQERQFLAGATQVNQAALSPVLQFLSNRATVTPATAAGVMNAAPNTVGSSQGILAQLLGYGQDAANTNFNAIESRANSRANNNAAMTGATLDSLTKIAGAYAANRQPGYY